MNTRNTRDRYEDKDEVGDRITADQRTALTLLALVVACSIYWIAKLLL
jgi:hypothetical protein